MKRTFLIGALCATSFTAHAQSAPSGAALKLPPIDFGLTVKDPKGKPFPAQCAADKPNCGETWSLGSAAYSALNAPRAQGAPVSPEDMRNAALAWRIYSSSAPLDLTTDEKGWLKAALFKGLVPALAYASCRMIVPEEECGK